MSEGPDHKKQEEHNINPEEKPSPQEDSAHEDTHAEQPAADPPHHTLETEIEPDQQDQSPAEEEPPVPAVSEKDAAGDTKSVSANNPEPQAEVAPDVEESGEEKTVGPIVSGEQETAPADRKDSSDQNTGTESHTAASLASHEETDEEDEHEEEQPDFTNLSKEALVKAAEDLLKQDDIKKADRYANEMKSFFDELEAQERQEALEKFKAEGGEEGDFDYKGDELSDRFYQAYRVIKERKANFQQRLTQDLNQNYEAKLDVLNRIREFVDSEETQVSINKLKELQAEWRSIGRVPPQHNRNLWANYHALINRFYDNRSIYFELKELDRKKNMEAKLELCEKAEALTKEEDIKKALRELDELHEEYKHIGPVPKEDQEALWQRFKAASDTIHARRREYVEQFKGELNENLAKKQALCDEVLQFTEFSSESIREWNQKTKEIQALQKRWEAVGPMPREKAKETNKKFWSSFKQFFAHKGAFFKKLDAQREENLKKKEALLERAEQLKESNDWQKTANELKRLQREWKEIGPVPEKQRESVYRQFKAACDTFFERKRESNKEQETAYQQNLEAKESICEQIEKLAKDGAKDTDKLYELSEEYAKIGFVPRSAIKKIAQRYEKAVETFMSQVQELDPQQKEDLKLELEVTSMKGSPRAERKLDHKETSLRKKISRLEEDISLWKNNISFFAHSKQADKLKQEYEKKIEEAAAELAHLKSQLDTIENMR